MKHTTIKTTKGAMKQKAISSIIVIVLIILIATILIGVILSWSKNAVRTQLDTTTESLRVLSELECKNAKYKVEFCTINTITKKVNFLITNNSSEDFGNFTLSVLGNNIFGDPMSVVGLFNTSVASGSSKLFTMDSDFYSIVKQDSQLALLDLDQTYTLNLVTATCPNSVVDLTCTLTTDYTPVPIFSTQSGTFATPPNIIVSAESDTVIYYTLDGTDPTIASSVYSNSITLPPDSTTTVKAIAVKSGFAASPIVSETYTVTH